jgi:hypothetical protein
MALWFHEYILNTFRSIVNYTHVHLFSVSCVKANLLIGVTLKICFLDLRCRVDSSENGSARASCQPMTANR